VFRNGTTPRPGDTANQASPICFARAPRQANVFASEAAFSGPLASIVEARGAKQQQAPSGAISCGRTRSSPTAADRDGEQVVSIRKVSRRSSALDARAWQKERVYRCR
jgi:hypothetical protein